MAAVIETRNLTKRFKRITAVNNLNLTIEEGDTFGFLGPNGAGKTTTIRMLTSFLKPTAGTIKIMGYDVFSDGKRAREHVGLVPDMFGLYEVLNADEHLHYYGSLWGMSKYEREKSIDKVLSLVRLEDRRKSKVKEYSHGMKQRLVIAQALLNNPKILFLDEPTIGLDPKGAHEVRSIIKTLAKEGMTIFMSSHLLPEVQDVCNSVGIINFGTLIKQDSIRNLTDQLQIQKGKFIKIELEENYEKFVNALKTMKGVVNVVPYSTEMNIQVEKTDIVPDLVNILVKSGARITSVTEMRPDLEQIFLSITET
ncbi:ABC transporter ATP-binding protein [[Eubacterium] cellulosolvens]